MDERYCIVIFKKIVIESFAVTDMTAITSAVLFRPESKGSGFHANERPQVVIFEQFSFALTIDVLLADSPGN